jgi:hypothetical protein
MVHKSYESFLEHVPLLRQFVNDKQLRLSEMETAWIKQTAWQEDSISPIPRL